MTISNTTRVAVFIGNGVTTVFPFTFPIYDAVDLEVRLYNRTDNTYVIIPDSQYSATGIGPNSVGGAVTYNPGGNPIPNTQLLALYRTVAYTQDTDIRNQDGFYPEVIERQLDKIVMQIQQLAEELDRALIFPPTTSVDPDDFIANAIFLGGMLLGGGTALPSVRRDGTALQLGDLFVLGGQTPDENNGLYSYSTSGWKQADREAEYQDFTSIYDLPAPHVIRHKLSERMSIVDFAGTTSIDNGSLDAAAVINYAAEAFKNEGLTAAVLDIPPARTSYLLDSPIVVEDLALNIAGMGQVYGPVGGGSMFKIADPAFTPFTFKGVFSRGSGLHGVSFIQDHPTVTSGWEPTDYPAIVKCDATLGEIFLHQIFGVNINKLVDNQLSGRLHMNNIRGQFFNYVLNTDNAQDKLNINDIHAWPYWTDLLDVLAYQQAHMRGIISGRNDTPFMNDIYIFCCLAMIDFVTTANGYTTHFRGGTFGTDKSKYGIRIESEQFTGHFDSLTAQGELFSGAGATVVGGRAILTTNIDGRLSVGQLITERHNTHCIEANGTNNRITIGSGSELRAYNSANNGSGAVRVSGTSCVVQFSTTPKMQDSYNAPLVHAGDAVLVETSQFTPGNMANYIANYAAVTGAEVRVQAEGIDTNIQIALAGKGPTGYSGLKANNKVIFRVDDGDGNGDTQVLLRPGIGGITEVVESVQTAADRIWVPKGAGRAGVLTSGFSGYTGTKFETAGVIMSFAPFPGIFLAETDQVADARLWRMGVTSGVFAFQITTDDQVTVNNIFTVTRSGSSVSNMQINTNLFPASNNTRPLGSSTLRWSQIHATLAYFYGLTDYADDTAAAAGGIAVGQLYRTGSAVKVRVT